MTVHASQTSTINTNKDTLYRDSTLRTQAKLMQMQVLLMCRYSMWLITQPNLEWATDCCKTGIFCRINRAKQTSPKAIQNPQRQSWFTS